MNAAAAYFRESGRTLAEGWDRFWFTPALPHTYALIRICTGWMLFYTHFVWSLRLTDFLGKNAWITPESAQAFYGEFWVYRWSHLWHIYSPELLWTVHIAALVVFAMLMLGLFTRVVTVLAFLLAVAYCNRLPGALFGLDQINVMLAMYLMIGQAGAVWSLDRVIRRRVRARTHRGVPNAPHSDPRPAVSTNIGIRLIQLHMCLIYVFSALGKLRGTTWWDGSAIWLSVANLEYQSLDLTWLAHAPLLMAVMTHVTVFWELTYPVFVWPRLTRPIVLALAVAVHGTIAAAMGMVTFGVIMIVGNLSFVSPQLLRYFFAWCGRLFRRRPA